jgi:MFS superfamily sulfate permease-like transporter
MFVVGLVVGALIALLLWQLPLGWSPLDRRVAVGAFTVLFVVVAFVGIRFELKLGLLFGMALGLLLAATPVIASERNFTRSEAEQETNRVRPPL